MSAQSHLYFRDLIAAVCEEKGLTQHQLAFHAKVSQTAISLTGSHQRKLSRKLAVELAKILGQDVEFWLKTYSTFENGEVHALAPFLDQITGGFRQGQTYGVGTKRLLNSDILKLFYLDAASADITIIKGFDPRRIRESSYYTRLGYIEDASDTGADGGPQKQAVDPTLPIKGIVEFKPGQTLQVRTLEVFHFPLWIEADLHPASHLHKKGLSIDHGPSIDPGFDGPLCVSLTNTTGATVKYDTKDPFLKLRFTVFERAAEDNEEFHEKLGAEISDDLIFRNALNDEP